MAVLIDGKKISAQVKDECKEHVAKENMDVTLAVIQVGNDPASTVYVGNKKKACEYIGKPGFVSCTPAGIIQLLKRSGVVIDGKECVIVGRSNIVGKPMAMLMLRENATVTVCHSHTKDLKEVTKNL